MEIKRPIQNKSISHIAGFGAALSALAVAPAVDAAVVALTPSPGTMFSSSGYVSLGAAGNFFQFNDLVGKSLYPGTGGFSWLAAAFSSTITSGMAFSGTLHIGAAVAGTQTFAFKNGANQVGWVKMNLGGSGGAITYLAAAFNNTPGGGILAGTLNEPTPAAVPEPSPLAALAIFALGATGVRRHRQRAAA